MSEENPLIEEDDVPMIVAVFKKEDQIEIMIDADEDPQLIISILESILAEIKAGKPHNLKVVKDESTTADSSES